MTYSYFNGTNLGEFATYMNDTTEGFFWFMILLGFFSILFFSLKIYTTQRAFGAAAVLTGFLGLLMKSIGLMSFEMAVATTLIMGIGLVALWAEKTANRV